MNIKRAIILPLVAIGLTSAPAAWAQADGIAAGAAVKDTSGGAVGTVLRVDGDHFIVKTDRHEVRLPRTSFTAAEGALLFAMTQAQLNAAVEEAKAQAEAKVAPGAAVTGAGGASVGTIVAVDAEFVTVKLNAGGAVRLPRSAVGAGPNGVVTSLTAAELAAAAGGGSR
jgi:preprotein translocase subunit YajC